MALRKDTMRLRARRVGFAALLIASAFVRPELMAMASDAAAPPVTPSAALPGIRNI